MGGAQVGACICAARYMVQSLREPGPQLLALDEEMPLPNGKRRGRSLLDGEASALKAPPAGGTAWFVMQF